jgi:hypothetical protein
MFPVRYGLNSYINLLRNSVFQIRPILRLFSSPDYQVFKGSVSVSLVSIGGS